jgi:Mg-chelatase subunit ChlD
LRARSIIVLISSAWLTAAPAAAEADAAARGAVRPAEGIRLAIDTPADGGTASAPIHMLELRGTAIAAGERPSDFDIVIVIDVSQSTRAASGADVDGDGEIGENPQLGLFLPGEFPEDLWSTDPEDTVLAAEVAAARSLLESVDPRRVRVGLVSFSGEVDRVTGRQKSRDQQDATLEVPLTTDFDEVQRALAALLARGSHGATNFAAGIRLATRELAGLPGAESRPEANREKVILFLTDGTPTFPIGAATISDAGDLEAAVNASRLAHAASIRINAFALGSDALARPLAATEVARVTRGTFTPVLEPGSIVAALQSVSFANVDDVAVVNLTTEESTPDVRLSPDGSFVAFVPVREGSNRILVNAVGSDGSETNRELEVEFRLAKAEGRMLARDLERLRRINAQLALELEAERVRRDKRRLRMQRELELRAERPEAVEEP